MKFHRDDAAHLLQCVIRALITSYRLKIYTHTCTIYLWTNFFCIRVGIPSLIENELILSLLSSIAGTGNSPAHSSTRSISPNSTSPGQFIHQQLQKSATAANLSGNLSTNSSPQQTVCVNDLQHCHWEIGVALRCFGLVFFYKLNSNAETTEQRSMHMLVLNVDFQFSPCDRSQVENISCEKDIHSHTNKHIHVSSFLFLYSTSSFKRLLFNVHPRPPLFISCDFICASNLDENGKRWPKYKNKTEKQNKTKSIRFFIYSFRPFCRIDANHIRFQIVWEYVFFSRFEPQNFNK